MRALPRPLFARVVLNVFKISERRPSEEIGTQNFGVDLGVVKGATSGGIIKQEKDEYHHKTNFC